MFRHLRKRPKPLTEMAAFIERQVAAVEAINDQQLLAWQSKPLEERCAAISACCSTAAEIMKARFAMRIPPGPPDPWPASTWEILRKLAADAHR